MKNLIKFTVVILISFFFLTSCTSKSAEKFKKIKEVETIQLKDMRVRRLSDNEIMILKKQESKYYKKKDTLTLLKITGSDWRIDNGSLQTEDDYRFYPSYYYKNKSGDSTYIKSWSASYKRVVIEKIFD